MNLSQQTQRRLPTIKQGLITGLDYDQIAEKCGRTRRTIDRDISSWLESGEFETWIKEEWVRLHQQIIHDDPTEAYRQVSKLVARMLTRRIESKYIEEIREIKLTWIKDDTVLQNTKNV